MIINEAKNNVEILGSSSKKNFTIKASSKAFQVLSSNLYQDKITAIIRELSCNAVDSHIAAGKKDEPIEVILPTKDEPIFSVRDNGVGMSPSEIENLYTTYFDSSKDQSNEFIGALGLGSKSPFCYTDQFTVESRYNGKCYTYSAFISPEGYPSIMLLGSAVTDECNGVTVSMPVKENDCYEFFDKAEQVFSYFETLPNVKGGYRAFSNRNIYNKGVIEVEDINIKLFRNEYRRYQSIVQGNVSYYLSQEIRKVIQSAFNEEGFCFSDYVVDYTIIVPIGTLSVSASREMLSLDKTTVNNLKKIYSVICRKAFEVYEELVSRLPEYHMRLFLAGHQDSLINFCENDYERNLVKCIYFNEARDKYMKKHNLSHNRDGVPCELGTTDEIVGTKTSRMYYDRWSTGNLVSLDNSIGKYRLDGQYALSSIVLYTNKMADSAKVKSWILEKNKGLDNANQIKRVIVVLVKEGVNIDEMVKKYKKENKGLDNAYSYTYAPFGINRKSTYNITSERGCYIKSINLVGASSELVFGKRRMLNTRDSKFVLAFSSGGLIETHYAENLKEWSVSGAAGKVIRYCLETGLLDPNEEILLVSNDSALYDKKKDLIYYCYDSAIKSVLKKDSWLFQNILSNKLSSLRLNDFDTINVVKHLIDLGVFKDDKVIEALAIKYSYRSFPDMKNYAYNTGKSELLKEFDKQVADKYNNVCDRIKDFFNKYPMLEFVHPNATFRASQKGHILKRVTAYMDSINKGK